MHRVRLLQYHNIIPYIVFDGGPLPAKKGTEVERKRYVFFISTFGRFYSQVHHSKRDESLTLAKTLARQGKHSLAREHYVKCVDITPQMAFQLIKVCITDTVVVTVLMAFTTFLRHSAPRIFNTWSLLMRPMPSFSIWKQ